MTPVLESITPEEQQALHQPEAVVRQDFIDVGEALLTIRDKRLYRDVHRTFGEDTEPHQTFAFGEPAPYLKRAVLNLAEEVKV